MKKIKILIICLNGIGNLIMALPMLNILQKKFSNAKIDFLLAAPRKTDQILSVIPNINQVFSLNVWGLFSKKTIRSLLSKKTIKLLHNLRKRKYDIVITTYPHHRIFSALLMKIIGVKKRVQHRYNLIFLKSIKWLLTHAPPVENKHSIDLNIDLIKALGIKFNSSDIKFPAFNIKTEKKFANRFWKEKNLNNRNFVIGLFTGCAASQSWKRVNLKTWKKLISLFNSKFRNLRFILFLGPEEEKHESHFSDIKNLITVKKLHLKKVIALISKCQYFIGMDSGVSHCVSLVKTPQTTIFKGIDPTFVKPFSKKCKIVAPEKYGCIYKSGFGFIKGYKEEHAKKIKFKPARLFHEVIEHFKELNLRPKPIK